ARFLSVAAGIVGVVLVFALTRRIAGPRAGTLALIVAVLAPLWLAESQEARMYTLSFTLLTAAAMAWVGIGDWGQGIGDWILAIWNRRLALGDKSVVADLARPATRVFSRASNPQSPVPNPQP
ncbi:MAG: glycosyltransferase family 39 protein, partial [Caldilineaceae bacterium]